MLRLTESANPFDPANFLSDDDYAAYTDLTVRFRLFLEEHKHSRLGDFTNQLLTVHKFICYSDTQQSFRALACGVFFGPGFILVHTNRLKTLFLRSKSGMNNCFQRLGYDVMRPSNDIIDLFGGLMPKLDQRAFQIKQWCLRIETKISKTSFPSHIPPAIADNFERKRIPVRPQVSQAGPVMIFPLDVHFLLNRKPSCAQPEAYETHDTSELSV
jgi:hypothetical protein